MKKGFISLIVILIASATALIISSTILLKSITEATVSADEESSNKALAAVNACAEYALIHLASTTYYTNGWANYQGDEELTIGLEGNSCYIYPITETGTSTPRTIHASSTVRDFTRKLSVSVATDTPVTVTSWQLVADFN